MKSSSNGEKMYAVTQRVRRGGRDQTRTTPTWSMCCKMCDASKFLNEKTPFIAVTVVAACNEMLTLRRIVAVIVKSLKSFCDEIAIYVMQCNGGAFLDC